MVDVGTGAGHVAHTFAPFMDKVIAVDPTRQMLDVTLAEADKRGLQNIEGLECFAESLPFEDNSIDGISCRVAAHHFLDVEAFVAEVHRTLKPQGWFLLVDTISPEDDEADKQLHQFESLRDPSHKRNYKESEWKAMISGSGLNISHSETRDKRLAFQEWMDRMSVDGATQQILRQMLTESNGSFADYLKPQEDSFCLLELTILAVKP